MGFKRGETDLGCTLFPKCFRSPEHPQRFTESDWEEKGEGGNRGDLGEKKENQKGERVINQ